MDKWLIVGAAVLFAAVSAGAQETVRFRSRVGSGLTGTERFTISDSASGHRVEATITMKRGATDTGFALQQTLAADWATETYSVEMSAGLGNAAATAERKGDSLALAVRTPMGTPAQTIPVRPRMFLMDNMLAAPYQVLLKATGGQAGAITVVVPFQLATVAGSLEEAGTAAGTLDGKPVVASKLLLKAATVTTEVYFDPRTLALLRVFVPRQDAELVREGFQAAETAASKPAVRPDGVAERELTFKRIDGVPYQATLCLPKGGPPPPVVVMLQGSGPQDRDESIGPNKPFRDLAWGMAARGIATFRYDKRTYAFPKSYQGTLDSESIDDAVDAVRYVKTLSDVDGARVFVLGHSLGGLAAIYAVERVPVAGLVLMAAGGRPMDQVIRDQVRTLNAGQGEAKAAELLALQDSMMAKVRAGTATAQELHGQPPDAIRDMIVRDPIAELRKTTVPVLVLKGGKDAQVFQADFDALQAATTSRPGSAAKLYPNLTHIFTPTDGPAEVRAIFEPGHVAPDVIATIAAWVAKTGTGP